jgi:hypothetical protein
VTRRRGRTVSRARIAASALAASVLLSGCHLSAEPDRERLRALFLVRQRHAYVGAAVALLLTLALRHVADARDEHGRGRYRRPVVGRMPGLLVSAILASEVVGMLLVAAVGAFAGYALGATSIGLHALGFEQTRLVVTIGLGLPVAALLLWIAVTLLRLTHTLPMVRTGTFVWAAIDHALVMTFGAAVAFGARGTVGGWRIGGAMLMGAGLVGLVSFSAGVGARAKAKRRARRPVPR